MSMGPSSLQTQVCIDLELYVPVDPWESHPCHRKLMSTISKAIYLPGLVEFYFDTARTIMDLTLSRTIQNFTKIRYHIPQEGGSFPSIEDRVLTSFPALDIPSKDIYNTRYVAS